MYRSNSQAKLRLLLVACSVVFVFACSSIPSSDDPQVSQEDAANDADEKSSNVSNDTNTEATTGDHSLAETAPFTGVDPMADIQINAEIKKAYQKVASLDSVKKYVEALVLLDNLKKSYPQLSGPDYQKARIYFSNQQLDKALSAIDLSLANNPRNYYALNLKGIILREKGDFDAAKTVYYKAIEIYPPYANSHLNLGLLADLYLKDLPLALMQYQTYMKLTPKGDKKVKNWIIELERRIKAGN